MYYIHKAFIPSLSPLPKGLPAERSTGRGAIAQPYYNMLVCNGVQDPLQGIQGLRVGLLIPINF